jgi:hypothetical protein
MGIKKIANKTLKSPDVGKSAKKAICELLDELIQQHTKCVVEGYFLLDLAERPEILKEWKQMGYPKIDLRLATKLGIDFYRREYY